MRHAVLCHIRVHSSQKSKCITQKTYNEHPCIYYLSCFIYNGFMGSAGVRVYTLGQGSSPSQNTHSSLSHSWKHENIYGGVCGAAVLVSVGALKAKLRDVSPILH